MTLVPQMVVVANGFTLADGRGLRVAMDLARNGLSRFENRTGVFFGWDVRRVVERWARCLDFTRVATERRAFGAVWRCLPEDRFRTARVLAIRRFTDRDNFRLDVGRRLGSDFLEGLLAIHVFVRYSGYFPGRSAPEWR